MTFLPEMNAQDLSDAIDVLISVRFAFDQSALIAGHAPGSSDAMCAWAEARREAVEDELGAIAGEYLSRSLCPSDAEQRSYALARAWSFISSPTYPSPSIEGVGL